MSNGPTVDDARALYRMLHGRGFVVARDLDMNPVKIRQICGAFPQQFIGSTDGYCNVDEASDADVEHAIASLRSRSTKISTRANALERVMHERKNQRFPETMSQAQDRTTERLAGDEVSGDNYARHRSEVLERCGLNDKAER